MRVRRINHGPGGYKGLNRLQVQRGRGMQHGRHSFRFFSVDIRAEGKGFLVPAGLLLAGRDKEHLLINGVVERYLDCGNPRCGFARLHCPDCQAERLRMLSCRPRGFCPSCHAKRLEEWAEWIREELLLDVPHRQVVSTVPRMLRIFFMDDRRLQGELRRSALRSLIRYFEIVASREIMPGVMKIHAPFRVVPGAALPR